MYTIVRPDGQQISVHTMGHVLWELNQRRKGESPYLKPEDLEVWSASAESWDVRGSRNYMGPNMSGCADASKIVAAWIEELRPHSFREDGSARAPQEMKQADWGALSLIGKAAHGLIPCFSPEQQWGPYSDPRDERDTDLSGFAFSLFVKLFGYGHNGPPYDASGQTNCRHEIHVAYALGRGARVPEEVLQDYRDRGVGDSIDLAGLRDLIARPALRGLFGSYEKHRTVLSVLRGNLELTDEIAPEIAATLQALPQDCAYTAVDDLLYAKGMLKPRLDWPVPAPEELGQPVDAFAQKLREMLVSWKMKRETEALAANMAKGHITKREQDSQLARIALMKFTEGYSWANRVATAISNRDLAFMLDVLDSPNNVTSQRAVEEVFGVKLRNVKAAVRRRNVFLVAGYATDAEIAQAEAQLYLAAERRKSAREAADQDVRLQGAKARASSTQYRFEGAVVGGDVFVETLVARGFTQLVDRKKGAAKAYYLQHPTTLSMYQVRVVNGTLGYAQAFLKQREDAQASPVEAASAA